MTTTERFSAPAIAEPRYALQPAPKVCAPHNGHDLSEKLQPSITRITPRALRERELSAPIACRAGGGPRSRRPDQHADRINPGLART
jgi:hypothetical protein